MLLAYLPNLFSIVKFTHMKKIYGTIAMILFISTSLFSQTLVAYYSLNGNTKDQHEVLQ